MKLRSLDALFLAGMREMFDCEDRWVQALPGLAEEAGSPDLKRFLHHQLESTRDHSARLNAICVHRGTTPTGWTCEAIPTLLKGDGDVETYDGHPLQDAVIAAICQKVLHFMIAAYRSACSRARHLGDEDAATLLEQSLHEEEAAEFGNSFLKAHSTSPPAPL